MKLSSTSRILVGGISGSLVGFASISTVALGGAGGLPLFIHVGLLSRDTVLVDRLREGLLTLLAENALGILFGPFGRLATIGAEVAAAGELELLIHRMYAECSVLASLRGPVLIISMYEQEKARVAVKRSWQTHGCDIYSKTAAEPAFLNACDWR